jgi:selenocysteine-specific elongation factor
MIRPCIIGTAGHIDHGKTELIRLLTGVNTDRLKEEQERGISIELGFASLTTPSGMICGVIDVPGHERFIHNMLAGAGGIDVILLVVAADEGIMPQTREHLDIVDLLGAHTGVVAVTKWDLVDPEWGELALEEIRAYLQGTCLASAPVLPVSSTTGFGKDDLLAAIDQAVAGADLSPRGKFTRLPIDRVFTMQGFGTVVTGTLWAGTLHEGERVRIEPGDLESRIKSLEVHNHRVPEAHAGQRVAVSLHALPREEIERGDWLTTDPPPPTTTLLQARFRCVRNSWTPIKSRMRIRFHLGASEVLGRIIPLEIDELEPGDEGLVQIWLESPALAERGDRFVVRSYSPMRTIGGGTIVDVSGVRRRRFRDSDLEALRLLEGGSIEERVLATIDAGGAMGLREGDLAPRLGQPPAEVTATLEQLQQAGRALRLGRGTLVTRETADGVGARIASLLEQHQREHPLRWGLSKSELKSRLEKQVHPDLVEFWIQQEQEAGRLHVREDRLRHGSDRLPLSPAHERVRGRMLEALEARGFSGPATKELLDEIGAPAEGEALLGHLLREGEVVRVPPDLLYPAARLEEIRARLRELFAKRPEIDVAAFKDLFGISRKHAVPLLEFVDRQRWTERKADVRVAGSRLHEPAGASGPGNPGNPTDA